MPTISLPNNWRPRPYQRACWDYFERGGKRAAAVWHRRAGKDEIALHRSAVAAFERPANYWHMLPEYNQARKAIWTAVNARTGKKRIDEAFPLELRSRTVDQEMRIEFVNGATWQVVGSDNFDSLVGSGPAGIVFSEWSLADPRAWPILAPMLEENNGWAFFIYTARGRNHGHSLLETAKRRGWFWEVLKATETGVFTEEQLAGVADEYDTLFPGVGQALFRQEYLCDFAAAMIGAYYGKEMEEAEEEGRLGDVPYDPAVPVHTAWDLGIGDSTAIWMWQIVGGEIHVIDFYQSSGLALSHYAEVLNAKPYRWGDDWVPHDARARSLSTGRTRVETLGDMRRKPKLVPNHKILDGINGARVLFPRVWVDKTKCKDGLEALRQYRADYDEEKRTFKDTPRHDFSSHAADAFRYMAMAYRELTPAPTPAPGKTMQTLSINELWAAQRPQRERRI